MDRSHHALGVSARSRALLALASIAVIAVIAPVAAPVAAAGCRPAPHKRCAQQRSHGTAGAISAVRVTQTTADLRQRLAPVRAVAFTGARPRGMPVIHVDDRARYQRFTGLGAAMTDTAAALIYNWLAPADTSTLLEALFGRSGIGLNLIRVPMGASDFTIDGVPYSYDDLPPGQTDPTLASFSIAHDNGYILPALRQALRVNPGIEILANPWSPPPWMKGNAQPDNYGNQGTLLTADYGPFADYFVKFIQAYRDQGIPVSAITPQNEPQSAAAYPGMEFPATAEASFVSNYLRPALDAAGLHPRIYGGDTGFGGLAYQQDLLSAGAGSTFDGLAWHCYQGIPDAMSTVHGLAPSLDQIVSECSPGISPYPVPELMIGSLRNWASSVALWNLALDPTGGGVQAPNSGCTGCTGIVTISQQTRAVVFTRAYYQLGQVGKFVRPGAQRIASEHFVAYHHLPTGLTGTTFGLDDVAFINPDGSKVLIAYNNSAQPIQFAVSFHGQSFQYSLTGRATVTFVWR